MNRIEMEPVNGKQATFFSFSGNSKNRIYKIKCVFKLKLKLTENVFVFSFNPTIHTHTNTHNRSANKKRKLPSCAVI